MQLISGCTHMLAALTVVKTLAAVLHALCAAVSVLVRREISENISLIL